MDQNHRAAVTAVVLCLPMPIPFNIVTNEQVQAARNAYMALEAGMISMFTNVGRAARQWFDHRHNVQDRMVRMEQIYYRLERIRVAIQEENPPENVCPVCGQVIAHGGMYAHLLAHEDVMLLKPNGHDSDYLYIDSSEKERIGNQIVYEENGDELKLVVVKGKKVYALNNRLGGIEIMSNNGIAHAAVSSDIEGVRKLVHWMQYLLVKQSEFPFFKCLANPSTWTLEEVDVTKEEMQLDVRNVIEKAGKQGIFDNGSFDEICSSWAASIVTGRAKLNGLPVGIIASQWKLFEKTQLADESVEKSEEMTVTRAGQVWYPDSAFKTSQAISDFNRESLPLVMIASLRGFSGGRKVMSDQVLTFGAHIIDELSQYQQPVIIYIPAGGELRGGAWAVVDSNVNRGFVHVIADESCRGGILEPNAVVGIKIRDAQIAKIMERSGVDQGVEDSVKSAFKKACVEFADMHDRWQRMEHVGAIRKVTTLSETREVFWRILRHEMILIELSTIYRNAPIYPKPTRSEALEWIQMKIEDNEDLEDYYKNKFHDDVTREIQESKRKFEDLCASWQK